MVAILYMIGTLLLINGILLIGRGHAFGAVLMVGGLGAFLVNVLRLLRKRYGPVQSDRR